MASTTWPVHFTDFIGYHPLPGKKDIRSISRNGFVEIIERQIWEFVDYTLRRDNEVGLEEWSALMWELIAECKQLHHPLHLLEDPEKRKEAYRFLFSLETPLEVKAWLRRYFVELLGSETILASDTHHQWLFLFRVLDAVIDKIVQMYARLDVKEPRKDGRTHFDHSWSVVRNLLEVIGYHSKEALFAAFLHDYIEDVRKLDPKKYSPKHLRKEIKSLLEPVKKLVNVDEILSMLDDLTKKELSEHLDFSERMQLFFRTTTESDIIRWERETELKTERNAAYFEKLYAQRNPVFFIKLADRLESLENFENNPIDFVERKLAETEQYFFPVLNHKIARETDKDIREIYHHILHEMTQVFSAVRENIDRIKKEGKSLYSSHGRKRAKEKRFYYTEKPALHAWSHREHFRVEIRAIIPGWLLVSA
jgi:hypothetical protein